MICHHSLLARLKILLRSKILDGFHRFCRRGHLDSAALHQRLCAHGDAADWYAHLVAAALDASGGDLPTAMQLARMP